MSTTKNGAELARRRIDLKMSAEEAHDLAIARAEAAAARAAAADADLDLVLAFVARQGGYRGGEDAIMLRGVRARRELRRDG